MPTLHQDIISQSAWLVKAFKADNLRLDYTLRSFKALDRFFDQHVHNGKAVHGGRFETHRSTIVFAIGAYIGQTILQQVPGAVWITNDDDPEREINATVKLPDGRLICPIQHTIKRFEAGQEEGLYIFGWTIMPQSAEAAPQMMEGKKRWWQFW